MKPTPEQFIHTIRPAYNAASTVDKGLMRVIEKWEEIRPAEEPDRWIPLSERRPTEEDADDKGYILVWSDVSRVTGSASLNYLANYDITHWRRTNLPQPTEEEIEAKEIEVAWNRDYDLDSFKAGYLAARDKFKPKQP
jgi:hypothetical protein